MILVSISITNIILLITSYFLSYSLKLVSFKMKEFVVTTLGFLVVLCFGAQWIASQTKSQLLSALNPDFRKFQKVFFAPYLFALFADWLQGPYVYRQVIHTL